MPRYEYYCSSCSSNVVLQHLSTENATKCPECLVEGELTKKLTLFRTTGSPKIIKKEVGRVTEDFIKNARGELKQQKEDLDEER